MYLYSLCVVHISASTVAILFQIRSHFLYESMLNNKETIHLSHWWNMNGNSEILITRALDSFNSCLSLSLIIRWMTLPANSAIPFSKTTEGKICKTEHLNNKPKITEHQRNVSITIHNKQRRMSCTITVDSNINKRASCKMFTETFTQATDVSQRISTMSTTHEAKME